MFETIKNFLEVRKVNKQIDRLSNALTRYWFTLQYIDDEKEIVVYFDAIWHTFSVSFDEIIDKEYINRTIWDIEETIITGVASLWYELLDFIEYKSLPVPYQIVCKDPQDDLEVVLSISQVLGLVERANKSKKSKK